MGCSVVVEEGAGLFFLPVKGPRDPRLERFRHVVPRQGLGEEKGRGEKETYGEKSACR